MNRRKKDLLCYCFGYSKEDFREALLDDTQHDIVEDIKKKMQNPGCFCATANPSGKCCLGDIETFLKEIEN